MSICDISYFTKNEKVHYNIFTTEKKVELMKKLFGIVYNWSNSGYFNEWIEQIFNKINNR